MKGFWSHNDLVEEAINFLRENEPGEGYHLCDSGGKDSTVIIDLAKQSRVKFESYYSCTRIDPPEVVKFLKEHRPETKFLYPKVNFFEVIKTNIPPTMSARWCCDDLKKSPAKKVGSIHRIQGIRAEESSKRAIRKRVNSFKGKILYYPIFHWKEYHLWEHIEQFELPYCKLYDEGHSRIGCLCCPFASAGEHRRNKLKYPGFYAAFEQAVKFCWERFKAKGKEMNHASFEEYMKEWYETGDPWLFKDLKHQKPHGFFY